MVLNFVIAIIEQYLQAEACSHVLQALLFSCFVGILPIYRTTKVATPVSLLRAPYNTN